MKMRGASRRRGFTLIEVIIALVLVAIAGTLLVVFMGAALTRSADSAITLGRTYKLQRVMENIRAASRTNSVIQVSASVGAEGTSQNNSFGEYDVIHNRTIQFVGNAEQHAPGTTNILKVTIRSDSGERLTALLIE